MNAKCLLALVLALLLACLTGFAAAQAAEDRPQESAARDSGPPRTRTIKAVAIVEGRTKTFENATYHLMAIISAPMFATNCTDIVFLVNGQKQPWLPVDEGEARLDVKRWTGAGLCWMQLPQTGNLELLDGTMYMPGLEGKSPEAVREEMLKRYEPFVIAVERIPVVRAKTMEELAAAMGVGTQKEPAKESPRPTEPTPKPVQADEPRLVLGGHRMWFVAGLAGLAIVGLGIVLLRWRRRT